MQSDEVPQSHCSVFLHHRVPCSDSISANHNSLSQNIHTLSLPNWHKRSLMEPNQLTLNTAEQMIMLSGRSFCGSFRSFSALLSSSVTKTWHHWRALRNDNGMVLQIVLKLLELILCAEDSEIATCTVKKKSWLQTMALRPTLCESGIKQKGTWGVCPCRVFWLAMENNCAGEDTGSSSADNLPVRPYSSATMQGRGFEAGWADNHART